MALHLDFESHYNEIYWNEIKDGNFSFAIYQGSMGNEFFQNTFQNCQFIIRNSDNNWFYLNNFLGFDEKNGGNPLHDHSESRWVCNYWNHDRRIMRIRGTKDFLFIDNMDNIFTAEWDFGFSRKLIKIPDS